MRQIVAIASLSLVVAALAAAPPESAAAGDSVPVFVEVEAGVSFQHDNGLSGRYHLPEIVGGGGALVDYDDDGDLDLYLVQSGELAAAPGPSRDRLYRNELVPTGELRFVDASAHGGLGPGGYGMGAASGDVDNDGWPDLYVTRLGSNLLLRNRGDGSFEDVTARAGADDDRWSVSASFFDYDRDGWLDLFVVNYVDFVKEREPECFARSSARDYCGPDAYPAVPDRLLHNRGDGTFEEVTAASGIAAAYGAGLGVVTADFDGDGWLDVYVANDGDANQLWINDGSGRFVDEGLLAGVALNRDGMPEAGMGVDAADLEEDGDEDIFLTHLTEETNTLYVNRGGLVFSDRTIEAHLHAPSLEFTGFGTAFIDYDNDGRLDLLALNGAVRIIEELSRQGDPYPLGQPNQLFHNVGGGVFAEVAPVEAGAPFSLLEVSRGALVGDLDNDGDTDFVQVNNRGPVRLLLNRIGQERRWIGLRLRTRDDRRDALGSRVELRRPEASPLWRRARTDGTYAAARDPRLLFGLADAEGPVALRVHWLGGAVEDWGPLEPGRYHTLVEGRGKAAAASPEGAP